jgi:hypothetical protein
MAQLKDITLERSPGGARPSYPRGARIGSPETRVTGQSRRAIAQALERDPSMISLELLRNRSRSGNWPVAVSLNAKTGIEQSTSFPGR